MILRKKVRNAITTILVGLILFQTASCGFILYPERKGQTQGRIDPGVAILDAILLLPGVIPGVIAFAVDFVTGAIYLPKGHSNIFELIKEREPVERELVSREINFKALERRLFEKTGKEIHIDSEKVKLYRIDDSACIERYFVKM